MFALCDQQMLTAQDMTKEFSRKLVVKACAEVVKPQRTKVVTEVLNIPDNLAPSALNCSFLRLQYWLEVNWAKLLPDTCISYFMFFTVQQVDCFVY